MQNNILVSVESISEKLLADLSEQKVGVELSYFAYPWNLDKANLKEEIQRHKDLLQGFLLPKSMHGAFYDLNPIARDSKVVEVCAFRVGQSLEIAAELGMKKVVFHTNFIPSTRRGYKEFWIEKQVLFWEKQAKIAEEIGILMLLENTQEEDATYIQGIVNAIQSPCVKICYDTGHSHCFTQSKIMPSKWVEIYQENLAYIHLHSNHGQTDEHIAFTEGTVNFEGFFEVVEKLNNIPDIIIEVKTKESYLSSLAALRSR